MLRNISLGEKRGWYRRLPILFHAAIFFFVSIATLEVKKIDAAATLIKGYRDAEAFSDKIIPLIFINIGCFGIVIGLASTKVIIDGIVDGREKYECQRNGIQEMDSKSKFESFYLACQLVALSSALVGAAAAIYYTFFIGNRSEYVLIYVLPIGGLLFLYVALLKEAVGLIFLVFFCRNRFFEIVFLFLFGALPVAAALIDLAERYHAN